MKRNKWFKTGLGAGAVALVAAAGLAIASPTLAQGVAAIGPAAANVGAAFQHGGMPGGRGGAQTPAIAEALGMTEADLRTELQAGKSVADVASAKGVALDAVVNAVIAAQTTSLSHAVTDGRITQAQADALLANLRVTLPGQLQTKQVAGLEGSGFGGRGGRGGPGGMRGGASLTTVATALGITEAELQTELQAGKTIAAVAMAKGVDVSVVSNALLEAEKTKLAQAVTDGKLTQAQADERLANAQTRINDFLNGTLPQRSGPGGPGKPRDGAPPTTSTEGPTL
jgi:hypothetical protein